jgi:uncharacterized cupin superfamily protein
MSQSPSTPNPCPGVRHVDDMEWQEWWQSPTIGGRGKRLSPRGAHIGVNFEELPPGANSGTAHYHMKEEEHLYVMEGSMEVRLGKEWYTVVAGDYLCFPAGDPREHKFRNRFDAPCRFLFFGEHFPDEVCVYPDNQTVGVRLLRKALRDIEHPSPEIDD